MDIHSTSFYDDQLKSYAQKSSLSKGRIHKELPHPLRNPYQRDRDRIIYTNAFRRLEYKTQVFMDHYSDHHRTRLTHSLEVSLISRTLARVLRIHEDLVEAISLAHDLGHSPFGHAGEKILGELIQDEGGFNHNFQSLRIVDQLEKKYPQFHGLNLTYEVRRSLLKHSSKKVPLPEYIKHYEHLLNDGLILEARCVDYADEISYSCHDLEDGLTHNFLSLDDIKELSILKDLKASQFFIKKNKSSDVVYYHLIKNLMNHLIHNLCQNTKKNLKQNHIETLDDVKNFKKQLVCFDDQTNHNFNELKQFLHQKLYQHKKVIASFEKVKKMISSLYYFYLESPKKLPPSTFEKTHLCSTKRVICDYIAGMTDHYLIENYESKLG